MADRIIIKNTDSEAKLEGVKAVDILNGEMLLVRETDKERLYCKNSAGVLTPIHRITDAGDFKVEVNVIEVQKADTIAGDVCAWDGNSKRFFRLVGEDIIDDIKNIHPIGVVVVPASHTDDGTARVISLVLMDYNNPDNGSTDGNFGMAWGGYGSDISTLDNKTATPYITNTSYAGIGSTQQLVGWYNGGNYVPQMSSDYYDNSYPNPFDEGTCFGGDYDVLAPSPYLTGGAKNEIYHSTANPNSIYADMNGKGNTEKILAVDNGVSTDWQTALTIVNNTSFATNTQPHTAAQCCWRYHTVGTQQGDWYLPSAGELGYLASRWKAINTSINKIISSGFEALALTVDDGWWSSTESSSRYTVRLHLHSDNADLSYGTYDKHDGYYVRAFLAV